MHLFAKEGVQFVTVDRGLIDMEELGGSVVFTVNQHAKHQYLVDLSKDVTRGLKEAVDAGSWVGAVPYGYSVVGTKKNKKLVSGGVPHE